MPFGALLKLLRALRGGVWRGFPIWATGGFATPTIKGSVRHDGLAPTRSVSDIPILY